MKDILKERNASDQKYCKEIGKDFDGLISRLNMVEKTISKLEDKVCVRDDQMFQNLKDETTENKEENT